MRHYSDRQISSYFLGKMPSNDAQTFELEASADEELAERVQLIERELIDDYIRGTLSSEDADCFEQNYLTTEVRRHRLNVSKNLWKIASEQPKVSVVPEVSGWQKLFGGRKALRLAFACAALLVFCTIGFYLLTLQISKTDVAEVREPDESFRIENSPIQNSEEPAVQSSEGSTSSSKIPAQNREKEKNAAAPQKNQPETKIAANSKNVERYKPSLTIIAKLLPGSLRDEGEQFINITPEAKSVKMLLSPAGEPNNYKNYRVVMKTPENETILTFSNLKSLSATIPVEKLENRTYIIFLEGQNDKAEFESISEYTFRVRR